MKKISIILLLLIFVNMPIGGMLLIPKRAQVGATNQKTRTYVTRPTSTINNTSKTQNKIIPEAQVTRTQENQQTTGWLSGWRNWWKKSPSQPIITTVEETPRPKTYAVNVNRPVPGSSVGSSYQVEEVRRIKMPRKKRKESEIIGGVLKRPTPAEKREQGLRDKATLLEREITSVEKSQRKAWLQGDWSPETNTRLYTEPKMALQDELDIVNKKIRTTEQRKQQRIHKKTAGQLSADQLARE